MIVVLRLTIGWHFFYEGLHKFDERHGFSAKGFLGQAKGPVADLYYMMLPDLDSLKRLEITPKDKADATVFKNNGAGLTEAELKAEERKIANLPTLPAYEKAWTNFKAAFERKYALDPGHQKAIDAIFRQYITSLREYAAEIETPVQQYHESLKRFDEEVGAHTNDTPHQRQRNWDGMMGYRAEGEAWVKELDKMGDGLQSAFGRVVNPELGGAPNKIITNPEKAPIIGLFPYVPSQMRLLDLSVTYGLTAIGICMMLGFCNRLASLGAAAFLANVVLSQFPWPTVYPPVPDMIGHFMIVNKDFVELIACLLLAALPAGRWGGLDFFLWHCGGKYIARAYGHKE